MYPILFHIGSYAVHSFGIMLMLAFIVSVGRACRAAARIRRSDPASAVAGLLATPDNVLDVSAAMIFAGVIGARVVFIALDWSQYRGHPATWPAIWEGGISFHGGLAGGLIAMALYVRRHRLSFLKLADLLAPSLMIGYAIGRVGCFLNGCCYGAPTRMPWGVRFHEDGYLTPPSHPTQLYSTLMSLIFFVVLVRFERRKYFDGQIVGLYLIFAGIERFVMEIWRAGYTSDIMAYGLTSAQFVCFGLMAVGCLVLWRLGRASRSMPPNSTPPLEPVMP